jgi:hypothetical protein
VAKLLKNKANASAKDQFERSALFYASRAGDLDSVNALLKAKSPVNDGSIQEAAKGLHSEVVVALVKGKHNPNFPSSKEQHEGRTALQELCLMCDCTKDSTKIEETIQALVVGKANPLEKSQGKNALFLALDNAYPVPVTRALLDCVMWKHMRSEENVYIEVDPETGTKYYFSPTMYVSQGFSQCPESENDQLLELLLDKRGIDRFYAEGGAEQPLNAVGMPQAIVDAEEKRANQEGKRCEEELYLQLKFLHDKLAAEYEAEIKRAKYDEEMFRKNELTQQKGELKLQLQGQANAQKQRAIESRSKFEEMQKARMIAQKNRGLKQEQELKLRFSAQASAHKLSLQARQNRLAAAANQRKVLTAKRLAETHVRESKQKAAIKERRDMQVLGLKRGTAGEKERAHQLQMRELAAKGENMKLKMLDNYFTGKQKRLSDGQLESSVLTSLDNDDFTGNFVEFRLPNTDSAFICRYHDCPHSNGFGSAVERDEHESSHAKREKVYPPPLISHDQEDSDDASSVISDAPSVASDDSLFSTVLSLSSKSSIASILNDAVEHFAMIITKDREMQNLYRSGLSRYNEERFIRNHNRLLKRYFIDLRIEVHTHQQQHTLRLLRGSLQRSQISYKVCDLFSQSYGLRRKGMDALLGQEVDRKANLNRFLESRLPILQKSGDLQEEGPFRAPDNEDKKSESSLSDHMESESSSSDGYDDNPNEEAESLSQDQLEMIVDFLTKSVSFERYKQNFRRFVHPSTTLEETLARGDVKALEDLLITRFEEVAKDEYSWLHELDVIGYSRNDLAELLMEKTNDAPWIYFERQRISYPDITPGGHIPNCVHKSPQSLSSSVTLITTPSDNHTLVLSGLGGAEEIESLRRVISELCGLAGVAPISRDLATWNGSVIFENHNSTSYITCSQPGDTMEDRHLLLSRICSSLQGFCKAAGAVQEAGFCCDSFTVLRITTRDFRQDLVEMFRVDLGLASQLQVELQELLLVDEITPFQCWKSGLIAQKILAILGLDYNPGECVKSYIAKRRKAEMDKVDEVDEVLHFCSLAVQFLCLGFLSYSQAHCRAIQPFFLDTPQGKVVLQGCKKSLDSFPQVTAQLVDLTCMGDMLQDSVLVFSASAKQNMEDYHSGELKFDVFAAPEDLIDTWGPGQFIAGMSEMGHPQLCGISIRGGIITSAGPRSERFHWSPTTIGYSARLTSSFDVDTKLLIGTAVTVNENCRIDASQLWLNSGECLEPLGPFEEYWEAAERQAGMQVGQYVNLSYLQTWAKIPGNTLKQNQLALPDNHLLPFLMSSWGLQVSCCTSIARRVRLCDLLADVMPAFVESLFPIPRLWKSLTEEHNIIQAFRGNDLQEWLGNLEDEYQQLVAVIVRCVLSVLAHTGVDRKGDCFLAAWIQKGKPFQCFKINCQKESYWTRILADSGDCATFAYVTTKCLETADFKCRDSIAKWHNKSALLETAVCRHRPKKLEAGPSIEPWALKHEDWYSMGKLDSLQWVKVDRQNANSNTCLIVLPSKIPRALRIRLDAKRLKWLQTLQRLREKQSMDAIAEDVVVLAGKTT